MKRVCWFVVVLAVSVGAFEDEYAYDGEEGFGEEDHAAAYDEPTVAEEPPASGGAAPVPAAGEPARASKRDLSKYVDEGLTLLMIAVMESDMREAGHILDGKIDGRHELDKQDHNGRTVLHHAAVSGSAPLIKRLIDEGADASIKENADQSACDRAKQFSRPKPVISLLCPAAHSEL
eukprot:g6572.t1